MKIKKIDAILILFGVFLLTINVCNYIRAIPAIIASSVVKVEGASGVVVYSNNEYSIILSSYHIVSSFLDLDGNIKAEKKDISIVMTYDEKHRYFKSSDFDINPVEDLLLIKVNNEHKVFYAELAYFEPKLGEEIFLASNPNQNYQSVIRGTLSGKNRVRGFRSAWQISGGTFYGSSGGGAFNRYGSLVAIAKAVNTYCTEYYLEDVDNPNHSECLRLPVSFIGYYVPLQTIKNFLIHSKYKEHFSHL